MSKILIVGVSGFSGRHLYAHLHKSVADELYGTFFHSEGSDNLRYFNSGINLLKCDVSQYEDIADVLNVICPDQIYFLSGLVTVAMSGQFAVKIIETNITGTANFYEAVRNVCPNAKILAVGSAEEYGRVGADVLPIAESTPLSPVSIYGISKSVGEQIGLYYQKAFGLDVRFTRTFHVCGPMQPPSFVISDFGRQVVAIEGGTQDKITVGNLSAKRDFSDIRDVACAYALLMEFGAAGKVYNVCSSKSISIQAILDKICANARVAVPVEIDRKKLRHNDVPEYRGNNDLLVKATGWIPQFSIDHTIRDVLDYWRSVQS